MHDIQMDPNPATWKETVVALGGIALAFVLIGAAAVFVGSAALDAVTTESECFHNEVVATGTVRVTEVDCPEPAGEILATSTAFVAI